MAFSLSLCAVTTLALLSLAHAQGYGNIFIVEAGVNGTVEPMQANGTTVFCPTKYTGGFNIECTHPLDNQRIEFWVKDKRIHVERSTPYYLGGNVGDNVFPWKQWKTYVDADNVLTLTCIAPDQDNVLTNHTAEIKFACPLPPKENCVTMTGKDVTKNSYGLTSGTWKLRGNSVEYVGEPANVDATKMTEKKVAINFDFLGTVTKQQLCTFDLTTPAKPTDIALYIKSDSGFAFSTDAAPIEDMLSRAWEPVYYDDMFMGRTKIGNKMYSLITASMREGMEVEMSIAGGVKGTILNKIVCTECDGDICTPDKTFVKRALTRCGL